MPTDENWWAGPWDCEDCWYTAYDYPDAEYHRRIKGHDLVNRRGPRKEVVAGAE